MNYALTVATDNPGLVAPFWSSDKAAYFYTEAAARAWAEHFGGEVSPWLERWRVLKGVSP